MKLIDWPLVAQTLAEMNVKETCIASANDFKGEVDFIIGKTWIVG